MKYKSILAAISLAGILFAPEPGRAQFADAVVDYDHGVGFATEFSPPNIGYTNPVVALGQPNRDTDFGAVTPFNPPFARSELVSLGVGGSLTVSFLTPVLNGAGNPYGLDFIIYGSAGFVDVDYPNGHTDGLASMFGDNQGLTRVSVSADGINFYTLNPALAPVVDGLFPTDGAGTFGLPVNPLLTSADLANLSFAQLRALYAGSAGGTGYDLAWAVDGANLPVNLTSISQVRVDVLSGRAEIDGFAVVPEPASWTLALAGFGLLALRRRVR
jgi:PEP-CTERM motif-containing protein